MRTFLRLSAVTLAVTLFAPGAARSQTVGATTIAPVGAGDLSQQPAAPNQDAEKAKFAYFETLGEKGWDVPRPTTADSIVADAGGIRSTLAQYGIGFLGLGTYTVAADTLHEQGGVQSYNGQRPTFNGSTQFSISLNTAQYGIPGGQLTAAMASQAVTWKPLGPRATSLLRLWYYQSLFDGKLELKAGYIVDPVDFYGTFVGGNIVSGLLGPNANLLYQLGESRSPLTAPGANARVNLPNHFYVKTDVQRSIDPAGAQAEHDANPTGFLFHTPNARALFINEVGYNRPASRDERSLWIRGGALYNNSPYTVFGTPRTSSNTAYLGLVDTQLVKTAPAFPARGIYAGATFIDGDPNVDATSRYYEARLYGIGIVPGRPADFVSLVYTHTDFSKQALAAVQAEGVPTSSTINNVSGSYSARLARGIFLINGLTYGDHAAQSAIVRPVLVFSSTLSLVF